MDQNKQSKGLLKSIHIPSNEVLNSRQMLRTRDQLIRKRKRCVNQLKAILIMQGISIDTIGLMK